MTASLDGTARIWDAASREELGLLRGHDGRVVSAAFSPDGERVVTASFDEHGADLGRGERRRSSTSCAATTAGL